MDRVEIKSIGDVLRQVIAEHNMQDRLDELKAAQCWASVVGDYIASHTSGSSVKNGILTVRIADAGLRHEVSMHKSVIMRDINRLVGRQIINNIRFIS